MPKACKQFTFLASNICRLIKDIHLYGYTSSLIAVAFIYSFYRFDKIVENHLFSKREKVAISICSIFISIFIIIGKYCENLGGITHLFGSFYAILFGVLSFFVFFKASQICIKVIFYLLDHYTEKNKDTKSKLYDILFLRYPFLSMFLVTFLLSSIYLCLFFPGVVSWDGFWQLDFHDGFRIFTDHHPAILTLFFGFLMDIARYLFHDNYLGILFYIFLQIGINAFVYGYCLKILDKLKSPKWLRIGCFIFYSCFPFLVINSITYIKDVVYYLILLFIFVYQLYHFYYQKDNKISHFIILGLLYIGLYFYRNTGIYIGIFNFIFLLIANRKNRDIVVGFTLILITLLGVNLWYRHYFLPKHHIDTASVREMLSIPTQQTARYILHHPNDISDEDLAKIQNVFGEDIFLLAEHYLPGRSDPIKNSFKMKPTKQDLKNYFTAWFHLLKKHPLTYVDATLENTYGYIYPNVKNEIGEELGFYNIVNRRGLHTSYYQFQFLNSFLEERVFLRGIAQILIELPILGLLYSCGFYTWILLFISAYLWYKKKYQLLCYLMPLYITFLLCIVSPVNSHIRYYQPIIVCIPMLLAFLIKEITTEKNRKKVDKNKTGQ